ncbi:MAG TPA: hypothetical protein VD858_10095 [Reyranella sp.]|nr:hypothetical protein [Reyranella sp.]
MMTLLGVVIEVPDGGPVFVSALGLHVVGGMTAVISGTLAALSRKRRGRHPKAGYVYLAGLAVVAVSAVTMALIRGWEDAHLLVIALVAAGLGTAGWQARRRRRPGWRRWHGIGMAGSFIMLLTGFYVDNGARLPVWNLLPSWAYWLLPSLIGWPLTWLALRRNSGRPLAGQARRPGLP